MKRKLSIIFLSFLMISVYAGGFKNWFQHCNASIGFNITPNISLNIPECSDEFYLMDKFHCKYYFSYDFNDAKGTSLPLIVSLRIPFWFNDLHTVGCQIDANTITNRLGQGHFDIFYSFNLGKKFQISSFAGLSMGFVNLSLGKLKPAFPGDPGYYKSDGHFIQPGTEMKLEGVGINGFNIGASLKYRPFKYDKLFFQLGYKYSSEIIIDKYKVTFDGKQMTRSEFKLDDIKIGAVSHIYLTFGWGL